MDVRGVNTFLLHNRLLNLLLVAKTILFGILALFSLSLGINKIRFFCGATKEEKKKDYKALFLIHQCVDGDNFENFVDCDSSKQAWEIL